MSAKETTLDPEVEEQRDLMIQFMDDVLSSIGGREACSDAEKKLGDWVSDAWERLGFEVRREPFACHPDAFLTLLPVSGILYAFSVAVYMVHPIAGGAVSLTGVLAAFLETLNYRRIFDRLFPKREGVNVAGVMPARGERRRRVIVNAHLDSAYEFTLWYYLGNLAVPLMVLILLCALIPAAGALLAITGWGGQQAIITVGWVAVGALPLVLLLLLFRSKTPVPGAMDDLAGVAILLGLGEILARRGPLESTEVVLLGSSSEEAGLRGAMRWAEAHRQEYSELPTYALVVDNVCDERFLHVVRSELLPGTRHDPNLVRLAIEEARGRGLDLSPVTVPLGATDATAFTRNGVAATALLAQDISRLVPNYHTRLDTLDNVRPQSLTCTLQVVKDVLDALDRA